ncbi:MAG: response regulator [Lachnospiraceae bacterium]|nr:response regulator [Lachnospiraceae bacterium]
MVFEKISSVYSLLVNLAAIMVCLFQYVSKPRKSWIYAIVISLANLLSNYYWCVYMLVMDDYPNVSSFLAYFGWNIAFLVLPLLQLEMRHPEAKRFFSPLCLLPIPFNVAQLLIYVQYGGIFNNIWQCGLTTISVCFSINFIMYYLKNRKNKARPPYVSFVIFALITVEYIMWTSSCFDWPSEWLYPYNYASMIEPLCYIMIPLAMIRNYRESGEEKNEAEQDILHTVFKPVYIVVVILCCAGGYLLALWMRNTLTSGIGQVGDADPYSVIAVMLFVVSVIIVLFSMTIILVVGLARKSAESEASDEARKIAERSNAAKSDFLANMSHEIRTPINAVMGMNEMILKESLQARDDMPESRDDIRQIFSDICNYSGNIDSAGNSLLSIINDILDFSKIEAGKMEIADGRYQLSSVLNDVCNMIEFKARAKGLEFGVDIDETLPDWLYGDEVRVRQVMINLLNNAVKYTREGSVLLTLRGEKHAASDGDGNVTDLSVSVKDTGIGIKSEDIGKLFSKFERVDLNKNSTIEGTGLGLAITRSLVEMMGGTTDVKSIYGVGSIFTVMIPQKIISDEPIGDFREKYAKMIDSMKARKDVLRAPDVRILVVDDTKMNLVVVRGLLKDTGISIDTADNGPDAIRASAEQKYDVILMDQRMPGMDGITAMHRIKEKEDGINFRTPFICLTADALAGARDRYIAEGFDDYLTKPLDSRALEEMLIRYLPEDKMSGNETDNKGEHGEGKGEEKADMSDVIDMKAGLVYCGDDEDFYREVAGTYVRESAIKNSRIKELYEAKDWREYSVAVHALKSTSRIVGATGLSEIAARLEKAADEGDESAVGKEHRTMLELYDEVVRELKEKFGDVLSQDRSDDEVMEFGPV